MEIKPVKIDSKAKVPEVKKVTLFSIDDVDYQIPEKLQPNVTVQFLADTAVLGPEIALARASRIILGDEALQALAECESVTSDQVKSIMGVVELMLYEAMDPKGK